MRGRKGARKNDELIILAEEEESDRHRVGFDRQRHCRPRHAGKSITVSVLGVKEGARGGVSEKKWESNNLLLYMDDNALTSMMLSV